VIRTALSDGPGRVLAVAGLALGIGAIFLYPWIELVPAIALAIVIVLVVGGAATAWQLERARGKHADVAIDGVRSVLGVLVMFAFVTPFWSLFDQKASTWVIQGSHMAKPSWFAPAQMQALNPLLVMLLIPLNNLVVYPWLKRRGWEATALRRMTIGIALAGFAYVIVGAMQLAMDGGNPLEITWQILPYIFLTLGEVLVSATGLEFAYSQAPLAMKGVIMSFWNLTVTVGNLWTLLSNAAIKNSTVTDAIASTGISNTAFQMFFFALFAFAAALAFGLRARRPGACRGTGRCRRGSRHPAVAAAARHRPAAAVAAAGAARRNRRHR
jgi:POT family proton-dependent oligopeptide transporter